MQARVDLVDGRLNVTDANTAIKISALIAQAELGDATGMPTQTDTYLQCLPSDLFKCFSITKEEWLSKVLQQHMDLKVTLSLYSS